MSPTFACTNLGMMRFEADKIRNPGKAAPFRPGNRDNGMMANDGMIFNFDFSRDLTLNWRHLK
jgi:hypothetical protein